MRKFTLFVAIVAVCAALPAFAEDTVGDPYPLTVCAVTGEPLGEMGEPVVYVKDGREVRFCCAACQKKFDADPAAYLEEVDKKISEDQEAHYPNNKCINADTELKDGGVSFVVGNRLMKTCCNDCKAKVEADPAKFIEKLDAQVIEAQKDGYKLTTCPVSGKELEAEGGGVDMVVADRLVKLCCAGCKATVEADPAKYISIIDKS